MKGEKYIEKLENNINYKINIDKNIDKYYNESNIATFTYKDYIKYCNIVNKLNDNNEEYTIYLQTNTNIKDKHDKVFRKILDNRKEASIIINEIVKQKIKPEEIEKYDTKYVTMDLKKLESDIIYKHKESRILYLIEHQTKIDYTMPIRMQKYVIKIMESITNGCNMNNLYSLYPVIIPIVLYTGHRKWNAKINIKDKIMPTQEKVENSFEYNLIDVNNYTQEELLKKEGIVTKIMLLEKAKTKEETIEILRKIIKRVKTNEERKILKNIINLTLKDQLGEETCNKLEKEMGDEENMLAVVEMLERENKKIFLDGRKEGRKAGRNEGILLGAKNTIKTIVEKMLEKNMPIEEIKEITKMSEKEILKLKKK